MTFSNALHLRTRPPARFRSHGSSVAGAALLLALATAGFCEDATEQNTRPAQDESIDEVTVYGTKSLNTLRIELRRAEEKVFVLFNEFNLDDEYDIHCEEWIPTGSLTKRRRCAPNYIRTASTEQDQYFYNSHIGNEIKSIPEMNKNLKRKMDALVAEQPDFREVFIEYETARESYEGKRREDK